MSPTDAGAPSPDDAANAADARNRRTILLIFAVILASLLGEWWISSAALLTTLIDAALAAMILGPAILFGHCILRLFRLPALPVRWRFLCSAALGLGSLSLMMLAAGLMGMLQHKFWVGVLIAMLIAGLVSLRTAGKMQDVRERSESNAHLSIGWQFLWFAAAPFLTLALLGATNPPGMIWQEEGYGYDVLEYHLALPREYLEHGVIAYAPHNVYANFPANMEMLYLLAMTVHGDGPDIGTTANMIHLAFAVLAVMAAWAIGRDISPQAGIVGGLALATCTWLEYLSGLAYVENGMLFYGICAIGISIRSWRQSDALTGWSLMAGLMAGFAAGCKYTALPMLVLPVAVLWLFQRSSWRRRFAHACVFGVFALTTFAPWLVKNLAFTGNPVFPLANTWFSATPSGWGPEQTAQWEHAHSSEANIGFTGRLEALWTRIPGDAEQRFGPAIILLALCGLVARRRDRVDYALLALLAIQLFVWLFATHLYARFSVPMILPLTVLTCRAVPTTSHLRRAAIVCIVLLGGAAWNFVYAAQRHVRESAPGVSASLFHDGALPGYEYIGFVNHDLPEQARLLLVGDARPFYLSPSTGYCVAFNMNPFFGLVHRKASSSELLQWLREQGYTHVLVHWTEVRRIARTYGFNPPVSEAEIAAAFHALTGNGLKLVRSFSHPALPGATYVEFYEIPARATSQP